MPLEKDHAEIIIENKEKFKLKFGLLYMSKNFQAQGQIISRGEAFFFVIRNSVL